MFCFRQDRKSAQLSKYDTVSKKGPKMALGGSDAKLMFRKRVYRHIKDIPNDPVEYQLLYAEAAFKVVKVICFIDFFFTSLKLQLPILSVAITTNIVSSNLVQARCTRYNIM